MTEAGRRRRISVARAVEWARVGAAMRETTPTTAARTMRAEGVLASLPDQCPERLERFGI
jgi:hypothetical protein